MINIGSFTELFFKDFCTDFKLEICLLHRKLNAKIIITLIQVAFQFWFDCRRRSKSGSTDGRFFLGVGDMIYISILLSTSLCTYLLTCLPISPLGSPRTSASCGSTLRLWRSLIRRLSPSPHPTRPVYTTAWR